MAGNGSLAAGVYLSVRPSLSTQRIVGVCSSSQDHSLAHLDRVGKT